MIVHFCLVQSRAPVYISGFSALTIHSRPFSSLLLTPASSPPSCSRPLTLPVLHVMALTLDHSENTIAQRPVAYAA